MVSMVFKNLCIIVLWMKVASALEGLILSIRYILTIIMNRNPLKYIRFQLRDLKGDH